MSRLHQVIIGASLSEPHTSVIALRVACVCVFVCLRVAIYRKFKLNERIQRYTRIFQICTRASSKYTQCKLKRGSLTKLHADGSTECDRGLLTV